MIHIIVLSLTVSLIQCIFLVFTVHSRHGPPLTLPTRLQSLVNLYECNQLPYFLSANNTYYRSISNRFFDTVSLSRIYCTFRSWPPPLTLPMRLQSLVNLYECNQLPYFLSANNTYCLSISKRFFDTVYFSRIYCTFQSWPTPLTLLTRLQSLVNLYKCI